MSGAVTIPARFNGPTSSGNGGYCSGAMAVAFLGEGDPHRVVQVTLRQPPPLETAMPLTADRSVCLLDGEPVLQARLVDDDLEVVEPVSYADAAAATERYAGLVAHPFPTCFVCGPDRVEGDGLRIFPGRVDEQRSAATWTPHLSLSDSDKVGVAVTWAALDCISGWTSDVGNRPMVLGRMACVVDAAPHVGEPHVVVGRRLGMDGRKSFTLATLYDADGLVVARAGHVWIEVDPTAFG